MSTGSNAPAVPVSIEEVEQFFYIGRQHGYTDPSAHRYLSPGRPGFKYTVYAKGLFRMMDEWCSNPAPLRSSGHTTIWFEGGLVPIPVWQMFYWGQYTKEAAKFLQEALRASYTDGRFYGGRGRPSFQRVSSDGDKLIYRNFHKSGDFSLFEGSEDISRMKDKVQLGYHNYRGFSLLPI